MRFMAIMIPGDQKAMEAGAMPEEALLNAMMKYNEELVAAGVMLGGEGLRPSSFGARVKNAGGKKSVVDGPFIETKEIIGGYWLWEVKSKEDAVAWAKKCPMAEGDTIELRRLFEPSDFGPEIAQQEEALIAEMKKKSGEKK